MRVDENKEKRKSFIITEDQKEIGHRNKIRIS